MSLISSQRTYETFFDIKLRTKKAGTRKNYRLALLDFDKFCKKKLTNSLENLIPEFRNASTEDIISQYPLQLETQPGILLYPKW